MLGLVLQLAIFTTGTGYFIGLIAILFMQKKTISEKIVYAATFTVFACIIAFLLIAALFGQGDFG